MQGNLEVSGAIVGNLDDLDDVTITSVADGEVLTYDSSTSKWVNEAASSAGAGTVDRVVETATTRTIATTLSLVAATYFEIQGTGSLVLEGDATLLVI